MTGVERRVLVVALLERRAFGSESPELVVRRAGLGRVEGHAALAGLERRGLLERDPLEGVVVTYSARMYAGLKGRRAEAVTRATITATTFTTVERRCPTSAAA